MTPPIIYIYALINPLTEKVFYIGASMNLKYRIRAHHNTISSNSKNWIQIQEIKAANKKIELIILEECNESNVRFFEEFYIDLFKFWGFELNQRKSSHYNTIAAKHKPKSASTIDRQLEDIYKKQSQKLDRPVRWLIRDALKQYAKNFTT